MSQTTINLHPGHGTAKNIVLRALPSAAAIATTTIWLYALHATPNNVILRDPTVVEGAGPSFPTQVPGLRAFYSGSVQSLCMVALADAPAGNQFRINKNGTTYAVYLVSTGDANASKIRVRTDSGTMAVRLQT